MGAAAAAWGLAVSAVAAGVLQSEAGIAPDPVAKFLFEHDRPDGSDDNWRLLPGQVVVVDEAGMLASADLARLARLVEQAEAKLVLVGDHAQLGAVEAGGLFRLLVETTAVELAGVRRFSAPWEADASLRLRRRSPLTAPPGDEIVTCRNVPTTSSPAATTGRRARWRRPPRRPPADRSPGSGREPGRRRGRRDPEPDRRLMTTAGAWVRNGERWVVTDRFGDGSLAVSSLDGRGAVVLPAEYVHNEVTLTYAVTLHKAQGVTVDRAVVVADEATTAEALYVGMTRGRHDNRALVVCGHLDAEHRQQRPDAIEVLTGALKRVSAEQAALEVLRSELAASESLATLAPRLANLDAWIARRRYGPARRGRTPGARGKAA